MFSSISGKNQSVLNTAFFLANCCRKGSMHLKIALTIQVVPDTNTALWRKLSKCTTSTDQLGPLLNSVAYIHHTGGTEIIHCALCEWY